ncbi:GNAT family N-acetyltransferase [Spirulina sp. CS-785/01]|uniref:GNAT family N-acetyltransferase n=1 Tax=Spirulina sp. CS-785/01 TaxID=3021716 RepID=UPI00233127F3|nr:GNAT family N-acetyltransferase [Spirulina sp. CS-785/01]MDB9315380.1 GNAT family N-acetyltransferase [Spirulina sp. CS-785/01]
MNLSEVAGLTEFALRPARRRDRWRLQSLVWQFMHEEASPHLWKTLARQFIRPLLWFSLGLLLQLYLLFAVSLPVGQGILIILFNLTLVLWIGVILSFLRVLLLMYSEVLRQWSNYCVIEHQNRLIACSGLRITASYSVIYNLFVHPQWRGQYLGSQLVQTLTQKARPPLYLACKPQRLNFYTRLGFQRVNYEQLPLPAQQYFQLFQPQLKSKPPLLYIMKYKVG